MTGSRVRQLFCAVALAALTAPTSAQWTSDKPPVLGPDDYPPLATEDPPDHPAAQPTPDSQPAPDQASDADQAPRSLQDQPPQTDVTPLPPPTGSVAPPPPPVEVGALGTPEGPPVGTLDASTGGLGDHLWSGTERAKAEDLLARAPLISADPVLRDFTSRVVLTRAAAPQGAAKKAFVTQRIERLLDAGLIEEAGAIAAQASVPNDAEFARVQAEAILIANRAQDACGPATETRMTAGDVFWMQLRAYCAALSGDTATAELTRQVLRAQGRDDPAYDTLVEDVLTHKAVPPGAIANPTAMHLFLYQQAGLPIPEAMARKMGTAANLLVVRDTRNSPRARFEAAERIITTGAASVAELKQIADAQDLPLSRVANASVDAPSLPFFMGQVLLRRAAAIEPRPEEKARRVSEALALGDKFNLAPLCAALQADVIASLKPTPGMHRYARSFARALILANHADIATRWTTGDALMRTIAVLASKDPARMVAAQVDMSTFAVQLAKNPPDPDPDRSYKALVLGLADTLNLTMPADAKAAAASIESQMWDGQRPGPGRMRTIHEIALSPDRRGEALLMLLGSIQTIGLRDMAPDVTMEYVRLLAGMNETHAAHALAFDAMAQYVPPPSAQSVSAQ